MTSAILVLQIIISLLLLATILIQNRGTGFGRVWGGSSSSFTRRGLEKVIFKATFILTLLFIVVSVLQFVY